MNLVQRKFYLPVEMYNRLQLIAKASKQTITQTLREVLAEGFKQSERQKRGKGKGMRMLLDLAKMAEREGWSGPRDLSAKHDKYFVKAYQEEHES